MRRSALKRTRRKPAEATPERYAFIEPTPGFCECGCGRWAMWRENHHIIPKQTIKREGRLDLLWDSRNRMRLSEVCHTWHTDCFRKLPLSKVPDSALEFAVDLFGSDEFAADWFARAYAPEIEGESWRP